MNASEIDHEVFDAMEGALQEVIVAIAREEGIDIDDLDTDDDFELVIALSLDGTVEWLEARCNGDPDDPYWELGDGD